MGRTGKRAVPIISPGFKYTFKSGLYFAGDMDIVPQLKRTESMAEASLSVTILILLSI